MRTEIKELLGFFARYLRFRLPNKQMILFLENLGAELVFDYGNRLYYAWNCKGWMSDVFVRALGPPDVCKAAKQLMPPNLTIAIKPGSVVIRDGSDRIMEIYRGSIDADRTYSPALLCTSMTFAPPCIVAGSCYWVRPPGSCVSDLKTLKHQQSPSYLADELMKNDNMLFNLVAKNTNVRLIFPLGYFTYIYRIDMKDEEDTETINNRVNLAVPNTNFTTTAPPNANDISPKTTSVDPSSFPPTNSQSLHQNIENSNNTNLVEQMLKHSLERQDNEV